MTDSLPPCPQCSSEYTYQLSELLVCPECAHEWSAHEEQPGDGADEAEAAYVVKDSAGNVLVDGDTVTIVKDLKVKGARSAVKVGTRVQGIRLIDPVNDHDIEARVDGFGSMYLKSSVVRKV